MEGGALSAEVPRAASFGRPKPGVRAPSTTTSPTRPHPHVYFVLGREGGAQRRNRIPAFFRSEKMKLPWDRDVRGAIDTYTCHGKGPGFGVQEATSQALIQKALVSWISQDTRFHFIAALPIAFAPPVNSEFILILISAVAVAENTKIAKRIVPTFLVFIRDAGIAKRINLTLLSVNFFFVRLNWVSNLFRCCLLGTVTTR